MLYNDSQILTDPEIDLIGLTPLQLIDMINRSHVDGDSCCQVSLFEYNDNEIIIL
jgi:hypothetical protein